MPTCRLEILDEVNVRLNGLSPHTQEKITTAMTLYVKNWMFMPAVRMGRWDGKIRFFQRGRDTYLNLMPHVLPILSGDGYRVEVVDHREEFTFVPETIDDDYLTGVEIGEFKGTMDDHQVEAINAVVENGGGILEVATGGGKTIITAALARLYKDAGRVLIIVPRIDLAIKTQYVINRCGEVYDGLECGIIYDEIKEPKHITVTTWQSLALMPELYQGVKTVIVDEAHEAGAKELKESLTKAGKNVPIRIGMTGTLPDDDVSRYGVQASLGEVVYTIEAHELQKRGFLANCAVTQFKMLDQRNPYYKAVAAEHEIYADELAWMSNDPSRLQYISLLISELATEGNTLVLVQYKDMGRALARSIPGAIFLSGEDSGRKRNATYSEINDATNAILIATYGIASTGIDIPRLFNLVLVEPGKSAIKVVQSIGRGLRKAEDKDYVRIIDVCSNAKFSSSHIRERVRIYKRRKYPFSLIEVDYYADLVQQ